MGDELLTHTGEWRRVLRLREFESPAALSAAKPQDQIKGEIKMNKQRRKELEKAAIILGAARQIIEDVLADEQDAFDNMPESLQYGERGEAMSDGIYTLEEMRDSLEEMDSNLCDLYGDFTLTRKEQAAIRDLF